MKKLVLAIVLFLATSQLAQGAWIHAKAMLAQILIASAWDKSLHDGQTHKPWSWADTWPIARLISANTDLYILEGAQGNSLAFAPGHLHGSAHPGEPGVSIIAGHRDTHFAFLEDIRIGDSFSIENSLGLTNYKIIDIQITDIRNGQLTTSSEDQQILLVTCYPFHQIQAGGPLRYVVTAKAVRQKDIG